VEQAFTIPAVRSHRRRGLPHAAARVQPYPCGTGRGPRASPMLACLGGAAPGCGVPRSAVAFSLRPQAETLSGVEGARRWKNGPSTRDFIILFCGAPSFGVGQENEIATQAGVPAIRLVPAGLSRMMLGSFIRAIDIPYTGSLNTGIIFDFEKLRNAFKEICHMYFQNRAFYLGLNGDQFGKRLRKLIDERCNGNDSRFADDICISLSYLHKLISEPFSVSNPSSRLLKRMAHRLGERVGYLLGEAEETDPTWIQSHAAWRSWIDNTEGLDAGIALRIRDEWRHEYAMLRRDQQNMASFRKPTSLMREIDWDKKYQQVRSKRKGAVNAKQAGLL
jgi:hypothetical protein